MSTITRGVLIFVVLSCMQGCLDIFAKIAVGHAPATLTNFYRYALLFICCLFWAFLRGSFLRLVAQTFTAPFLIAREYSARPIFSLCPCCRSPSPQASFSPFHSF